MQAMIRQLAERDAGNLPLLSVYLDVRPEATGERPALRAGLVVLKDRLNELRRTFLPRGEDLDSFERDVERIDAFVQEEMQPSTAGLAIFACAGIDLFEVIESAVPFRNQVSTGRHADLFELARLADEYETSIVAVVDSNTARLFLYRQAKLEEITGLDEESTNFQKRSTGGWSQARYQRHIDKHRRDFAREMAAAIAQAIDNEGAEHLILAGDEVAITPLKEELPPAALAKLRDVLRIDIRAARDDIAEEIAPLLDAVEREAGTGVVDQLVTELRRGRLGVAGAAAVAKALDRGQVDVLLLEDKVELSADERADLVRQASLTGVRVEIVEDSAQLRQLGGVGALLRYID